MSGEHQKPDKVYFGADLPAVRRYIDDAIAAAINQAAGTVRSLRDWCDRTEAGVGSTIADTPRSASAEVFGYNDGLMKAVHEIRALLPAVPASAGEEPDVSDRDL